MKLDLLLDITENMTNIIKGTYKSDVVFVKKPFNRTKN